jgi:polyphosphate kinase
VTSTSPLIVLPSGQEIAAPQSVPVTERFDNRELSWLDFDTRVLALAENTETPLLERVRFLAIFNRNLDEFFQIRVAGLKEQVSAGLHTTSPDGMSAVEQLERIGERVRDLMRRQHRCWARSLRPRLAHKGIQVIDFEHLDDEARAYLSETFHARVLPILTPLSVDPSHPFPYISNLSLNLAVHVRDPGTGLARFARVKVPPTLPRFLPLPDGERFVPIEQVIATNLKHLFPGMELLSAHPFRVTRDADVELEIDEADDLIARIETVLRQRERSPEVVRLELHRSMPKAMRRVIIDELQLAPGDVYVSGSLLGLGDTWELTGLDRPDLKYAPWTPITQARLKGAAAGRADLFSEIRKADLLVQHPYDAFATSVELFVSQASRDPHVLAIKQTLYRTSDEESPIIRALIRAAESGKQAVALVELTARFDEEANIAWARLLEQAGVHVVYGVVGLKTHAKISLVVREEGDKIRRYCHIGTGNYHPETATIYEDVGVLTADPVVSADVADLFNYLTGYSHHEAYQRILVAPLTLRRKFTELIREQARPGGRIDMKMNSLVDSRLIDELYAASQAGASINLIVRGICCLRPGIPGMSERIRVRSIVGRYLEHSRIFRFGKGAQARYFIGSADLMPRNLDHRVECTTEVVDPVLRGRLKEILRVNMRDDVLAWELTPSGWRKVPQTEGFETHEQLRRIAEGRAAG